MVALLMIPPSSSIEYTRDFPKAPDKLYTKVGPPKQAEFLQDSEETDFEVLDKPGAVSSAWWWEWSC